MSKIIKEDCKSISVYKLKEWGYLKSSSFRRSNIHWSNCDGERKGDVNIEIDFRDPCNKSVVVEYKIRRYEDGWRNVKQRFDIVSTKCNYGGERCWFICSLYSGGAHCGRRVAKLYLTSESGYFGCRHCFNLTYEARNSGYTYSLFDLDKYEEKIKKRWYKGKITRKYRKYIKMQESSLKALTRFGLA